MLTRDPTNKRLCKQACYSSETQAHYYLDDSVKQFAKTRADIRARGALPMEKRG